MAHKLFSLLNQAFLLMSENRLRNDIDDTLLEKLLTLLKKCEFQQSVIDGSCTITFGNQQNMHFDFIEELVKQTTAIHLIEKVLCSVAEPNTKHTVTIKAFGIRLLGLIFENPKKLFPYENLMKLPLLKDASNKIISDHIPSIQDALLGCLSAITKQIKGVLWFINHSVEEFVFSTFNCSSYYVRNSAAKFFVKFITWWTQINKPEFEDKKTEKNLKEYFRNIMRHITKHIHYYRNSEEINFSECCIFVTKQLLELENSEEILGNTVNLTKDISECFLKFSEEEKFNNQLIDVFLRLSFKSQLGNKVVMDVIKDLIMKENIIYSFNLASSYSNIEWEIHYSFGEIRFFLLPLYIITNIPLNHYHSFYQVDSNVISEIIHKKMENKSDCKLLFCSALSALQKLVPLIAEDEQRGVAVEIIKIARNYEHPHHKWHCFLLEDRLIHRSFLELFTSFLSIHSSFISEGSDLVFQIILELLKKPSSDNNFVSQLLLQLKKLLIQHKNLKFDLKDLDKDNLIQMLCRMLLDNRESVVDSAIHLAGQILIDCASPSWQERVSKHGIHSIIWDIAIHGSHDGSVRSTALKAIIEGCLESQCLDEMKLLKGVTEIDIVKILFDLTYNPDFFLQREALSCLYQLMKSKWNDLPPSSREYLFSGLVSAIKSLDLELKLISLDVWLWLIQEKFTYSGTQLDLKNYIENLANYGFGLSLILASEDYDEAIRFKAADILFKLKNNLMNDGVSKESLNVNCPVEEPEKYDLTTQLLVPFTLEERDEGIDSVMEISTTEQITKICRPPSLSDLYDFKQEYFSVDSRKRRCSVSVLWRHIWCEDLASILHPTKVLSDINSEYESLLNDIVAAKVSELQPIEETPDCY